MKKNVAVITGGYSSEYVISVESAKTIMDNIDKDKYIPYRIEIKDTDWTAETAEGNVPVDKNDFSIVFNNTKIRFDIALIMIHGSPGEDGKLQGYLEMQHIPYTASNVLSSSLSFNKHFTKDYLVSKGIKTAPWLVIGKNDTVDTDFIIGKLGLPCFVKPNNAGSSFGVTKVKTKEELAGAIKQATTEDNEILIEKCINGVEITCGVLRTSKKEYMLPITEIVSKNEFFDYEAKYTDGITEEITPARIEDKLAEECKKLSLKIYDLLQCKWFSRVDYIYADNTLYLLEINTIPGMSTNSIIPRQLRAANIDLKEVLNEILEDCN